MGETIQPLLKDRAEDFASPIRSDGPLATAPRQFLIGLARALDGLASHRTFRQLTLAWVELTLAALAAASATVVVYGPTGWGLDSPYLVAIAVLITSKLVLGTLAGAFGGRWRFVGLRDATLVAGAGGLAGIAALATLGWLDPVASNLRLVVADTSIYLVLACGVRLAARTLHEWERRTTASGEGLRRRVVIVGAGEAAAVLVKGILTSPKMRMDPVALVDDDANKHGSRLHGVPVAGAVSALASVAEEYQADEIVIAIPSGTPAQTGHIVDICAATTLPFRIAPDPEDVLGGRGTARAVRDVLPSDLLGRPQADLHVAEVRAELKGARVLITGAAGSIGSELVRQLVKLQPAVLYLLDRNENDLYFLCEELQRREITVPYVEVIQDIRDEARLTRVFTDAKPTHVFHAAAFKHVPLMEYHVVEAVENNILGTWSVLTAAQLAGTRKFVLISTDKAVRPTNVMGATKRFAEVLVAEATRGAASRMDGVVVRFGNVLGTAGSVVPLFERQIAEGGPVTVTSREATRYFMTPPEAAQLVLQAASLRESAGKVAILDMGTPVRIWDLADRMIRMNGLRPGADIDIVETGLRPGEKLHEELWWEGENSVPSTHPKILLAEVGALAEHAPSLVQRIQQLVDDEEGPALRELLANAVGLTNGATAPRRGTSHPRRNAPVSA